MSTKELLYIEDALGHEQILQNKCQDTAQKLQDPDLKNFVNQLAGKHQEIFGKFFQLV